MNILVVDPILYTVEQGPVHRVGSIRDTLVVQFCLALTEAGHCVTMVSAEEFKPLHEEPFPFQCEFMKARWKRLFPVRALPFLPKLPGYIFRRRKMFDLVVCGEIFALHSLMAALIMPKKTLVWHELALHPRIMGGWASRIWYATTRPAFARVRAIVPRSERARDFLSRYFRNVSMEIVRHGVDLRGFPPAVKTDHFIVVSQLIPRKRVDLTLEAFAEFLEATRASTRLLIVGDGPSRTSLEAKAKELGIDERCDFLGKLPHHELAKMLAQAKALLYSGTKDNSLLVVGEAVGSGTPVLISDSVDNAELVRQTGVGIAQDNWGAVELARLGAENLEFQAKCIQYRSEFDIDEQVGRMVALGTGAVKFFAGAHASRADACRPRLAVVSQNCFAQCDLLLLPKLRAEFEIDWSVFFPRDDHVGADEQEYRELARSWGIAARVFRLNGRLRSVRTLVRFLRLGGDLRRWRPDVVYVNATGCPWLAPALRLMLRKDSVVWAIHDVQDHRDKGRWTLDAIYKRILVALFDRFHLLSKNQLALFEKLHPGKVGCYAPHPPLSYGPAQGRPVEAPIRFLFFGYIDHYKGVDLLVEAAQRLWEQGRRGFEVVVAGRTECWEEIRRGIRVPELFKTDIRLIPNNEIPKLYSGAHWLVLPYRDATQSGPLALAYEYGVPVIASDLPAFKEFLPDGAGWLFRTGDVDSLQAAMAGVLDAGDEARSCCIAAMRRLYDERFGAEAVARSYMEMLSPADRS